MDGLNAGRLSRRAVGLGLVGAAFAPQILRAAPAQPQVYFLSGIKVMTSAMDGAGIRELVTGRPGGLNDGIAYDPVTKRIFWTNMGKAANDDGYIQSVKLDGSDLQMVVPPGGTYTPKQMKIDAKGRKMYWSDREGMRVMRSNLDGSNIEVLIQTGSGPEDRKNLALWCVGIALDTAKGHIYWTQKGGDNAGQGTLNRMGINLPAGATPTTRKDVEVLFSGLPEPIDIDLDLTKRVIYWTDRGDNTVSRAPMTPPKGYDPAKRTDRQILVRGMDEAIGVSLDLTSQCMVYTSLGGQVGCAKMDGSENKYILLKQGVLTGVILV